MWNGHHRERQSAEITMVQLQSYGETSGMHVAAMNRDPAMWSPVPRQPSQYYAQHHHGSLSHSPNAKPRPPSTSFMNHGSPPTPPSSMARLRIDSGADLSDSTPSPQTTISEALSPASGSGSAYKSCGDSGDGGVSVKKKKGGGVAGKSIEEELCLICGDRASGYHYNALSCEGCKGFFRRSITRNASYSCKYGGNCEMDMWMRRRCQHCRLRRCREVGMKEECLLSDDQCRARDVRRKARQRIQKCQNSPDLDKDLQPSPDSNCTFENNRLAFPTPREHQGDAELQGLVPLSPVDNPLDYISTENRDLIEKLVLYQDKFELPSEEDVQRVSTLKISDAGRPKDVSEQIYKHMAEMTILVTQLVVEFAKRLPGFLTLNKDDQIVLLKASASEVMILRTARRYDVESDTVIFANGMPMTRDSLRMGGLHDHVDNMFAFCRKMGLMQVDNAEYGLLTAICILSERPGLTYPRQVEEVQKVYLDALMSYLTFRRPANSNFLAKLLIKLTDLRTLSAEHADVLFNLKLEKGSLPPLLTEYFDVQ